MYSNSVQIELFIISSSFRCETWIYIKKRMDKEKKSLNHFSERIKIDQRDNMPSTLLNFCPFLSCKKGIKRKANANSDR